MTKKNYALRIKHYALVFPTPPTPPTPPKIEKGDGAMSNTKIDAPSFFQVPFVNEGGVRFENPASETFETEQFEEVEEVEEVEEETPVETPAVGRKQVTTPETLARDAVANGAGPLTKRTVTRPDDEKNSAAQPQQTTPQSNQIVTPIPQETPALSDTERGKAVLREFQAEDQRLESEQGNNLSASTQTAPTLKNNFNQSQGQGGLYWIVILVVAIVGGFIFVRKSLISDKPKLKKSDLFEDSSERLKAAANKVSKKTAPPPRRPNYSIPPVKTVKPVRVPKKEDEDKGKHFEVRV